MYPFEKLDAVLNLLVTTHKAEIEDGVPIALLDIPEIISFLENEEVNPITLTEHEVGLILIKLKNDGYIHIRPRIENVIGLSNNTDRWYISYEGYVFNLQGGYNGEIAAKNAENSRLDKLEISHSNTAERLNFLTKILAFATIGMLIIELARLVVEHNPFPFLATKQSLKPIHTLPD